MKISLEICHCDLSTITVNAAETLGGILFDRIGRDPLHVSELILIHQQMQVFQFKCDKTQTLNRIVAYNLTEERIVLNLICVVLLST